MAIFKRKRYVWNEPWFFQQKIRPAKAWAIIALIHLAVGVLVGTAMAFVGPPGAKPDWLEVIGLGFAVPVAMWWVLDGANTRRQAVLFEDSLVVGGDMGKYSAVTTYRIAGIDSAAIVMPEVSKWPEPALHFIYEGEEQCIGIERRAGLKRLAQALHDAGIDVQLADWRPGQENEFEKAFTWQADPKQVTKTAQLDALPAGSISMMSPDGILLAIVRQCWAFLLWFALAGYSGYYVYQNWGNLGLFRLIVLLAVVLGTGYLTGLYSERIGCASTSKGLIRMSRNQIRKRPGREIDPDADDVYAVEVLERDQFDKSIQKIHEMGLIQIDHAGQRLLYEGKQARWSIPAKAVRSLSIEEVQCGTPGQSASGILNYYVVLKFVGDGDQEFGFRDGDRDYGEFNDIKRAEGAIRIFNALEALLVGRS